MSNNVQEQQITTVSEQQNATYIVETGDSLAKIATNNGNYDIWLARVNP